MIDKILEHVFLSGAGPVLSDQGRREIIELSISHVLTVSAMAVPPEKRIPDVDYKFLFAMDMPDQDILSRLEEGVRYIETAVGMNANVLIHCEAGISRSVTFVAAYLMKRFRWSAEKAVMYIRNNRPIAQPNAGFMEQLQTFESLGYCADSGALSSSQKYKLWCVGTGNKPQPDAAASSEIEGVGDDKSKGNKFRCGKCRQAVFFGEHLIKHNRTDGELCTFGYLIEPMKWMKTDEYQGKICCPSCGEKLGNYTWGGRQCLGEHGMHCSEQVTPWVHLHKGKIDEMTPRVPIDQIQRILPSTAEIPTVIIS